MPRKSNANPSADAAAESGAVPARPAPARPSRFKVKIVNVDIEAEGHDEEVRAAMATAARLIGSLLALPAPKE